MNLSVRPKYRANVYKLRGMWAWTHECYDGHRRYVSGIESWQAAYRWAGAHMKGCGNEAP